MKQVYKTLQGICLCLFGLAFVACSSDKDDFEGVDNYIISLTLHQAEHSYPLAIQGDQLLLRVPEHTDLSSGIKAEVKLAELARIEPDPSQISDWSVEHEFVVRSHNQSTRHYYYRVEYESTSFQQTVKLSTQKELDEFGKLGIKRIDGNLIIGQDGVVAEEDLILSLAPLQGLQAVSQNISFKNSFRGSSLAGLDDLEQAGNLYFGSKSSPLLAETLTSIELPQLQKSSELVVHSPYVKQIKLPQLRSLFSLDLIAEQLEELQLDQLQSIRKDFNFKASIANNPKNEVFTQLHLPALAELGGSLQIQKIHKIASLELPQLKQLGGSLLLKTATELQELDLKQLEKLGGSLEILEAKQLKRLELPALKQATTIKFDTGYNQGQLEQLDLTELQEVADELFIKAMGSLSKLEFPALQTVAGKFTINGLDQLTDLLLPKLESCAHLYLYKLKALKQLDLSQSKLGKLETVTCNKLAKIKLAALTDLIFNGGSELGDLPEVLGITELTGRLDLSNYSKTKELRIPHLQKIGHINCQTGISNGGSLLAFPDLVEVKTLKFSGTTLYRVEFPQLERVTSKWDTLYFKFMKNEDIVIPKLKEVKVLHFKGAGYAGDAHNMPLTNLDLFQNLEQVEEVEIVNWGNLVDYTGLKNIISQLEEKNWKVNNNKYNPTLQQLKEGMYVQP